MTERNARAYDTHAHQWDPMGAGSASYRYLERPAMAALIPSNLEHKSILSIGVGAGDELAELIKQNPRRIVGVDISEQLLKKAHESFPSIEIEKMDMMELTFPDATFDFVYSSLAFHYAKDWDVLMAGIRRVLRPGGMLLFSVHHPVTWSSKTATGHTYTNERGVGVTEHATTLHAGVPVTYYSHLRVEDITEAVEHAEFEIVRSVIPEVVPAQFSLSLPEQEKYDSLVKKNTKTPLFMVVLARKRV